MGHILLSSADPRVGQPFTLTLEIEGVDAAGNPLAVIGDVYEVSATDIRFVLHEMEVLTIDAADNHRAVIEFVSRDGFQLDGDHDLEYFHRTDPDVFGEITVNVAAAVVPAAIPLATATTTAIANPAAATPGATTPPATTPKTWKEKLASIDWRKAGGWAITLALVAAIVASFYNLGFSTHIGWWLTFVSLIGALITKGGRNKLGWVIAVTVLVCVILLVRHVILLVPFAVNQVATNGASTPQPKAPTIPPPATRLERIAEKVAEKAADKLEKVLLADPPSSPTAATAPSVETPPVKSEKNKTSTGKPKGKPYKIPSL